MFLHLSSLIKLFDHLETCKSRNIDLILGVFPTFQDVRFLPHLSTLFKWRITILTVQLHNKLVCVIKWQEVKKAREIIRIWRKHT